VFGRIVANHQYPAIIMDNNRQEIKDNMKKTNQRTKTDRLWVRIEALQWVLAQILVLRG
jgi:hypothetical protein